MKTFKQSLCIFLCTATIIFSSLSCSPKLYLDAKGSSMKIDEGYLASYVDSNVFVYKTKAFARMDMERLYPRFFEVKLPRNIQYFCFRGQDRFEFYYDKKQVVYIKIDLYDKGENNIDTTYQLALQESNELINFDEYSRSDTSRYILQRISFKKSRKTTVLKKGAATIILYNIVPKNHTQFLRLVNQFNFLLSPPPEGRGL